MIISDRRKLLVTNGDGSSVIVTAKNIRQGIGQNSEYNRAVEKTLSDLENMISPKSSVKGLGQRCGSFSIQITIL